MKEYRVIETGSAKEAENAMNGMAQDGWTVKAVTYWQKWTYRLVITFEREKQ